MKRHRKVLSSAGMLGAGWLGRVYVGSLPQGFLRKYDQLPGPKKSGRSFASILSVE